MKKETIMIENPFEFGRAVEDEYFTDRIDDAKRLEANLTHGINTGLSHREVLNEYRLESSANVQSVKKALIARDFIDVDGDFVSFNDPFFKLWIRRNITQL